MAETYYEVLGVGRDASTDEVMAAYRERLKETHPDVNDAADARSQTRRLIDAKDVLADPAERERYDELGHESYLARVDGLAGAAGEGTDGDPGTDPRTSGDDGTGTSPGTDASRGGGGGRWSDERRSGWGEDGWEGTDRRREQTERRTGHVGGREDRTDQRSGRTERGRKRGGRGGWQTGTTDVDGARWRETERADRRQQGGSYATGGKTWRTWDSDRSYAVSKDTGGFFATGEVPDSSTVVTLLAIFLVYPVFLWGAMTPAFPLVVNVAMIFFTVFVIAFLQSVPTAAVITFGFWSVVLPLGLVVVAGVDPVSLVGLGVVIGVVLPLGFSLLVRSIVRF